MATGLPCVVSDRVGCATDLAVEGRTGEVFPCGDIFELARAIERVRIGGSRGHACRELVSRFSFRTRQRASSTRVAEPSSDD